MDDFVFYRLDGRTSGITATRYDLETLTVALESSFEVR